MPDDISTGDLCSGVATPGIAASGCAPLPPPRGAPLPRPLGPPAAPPVAAAEGIDAVAAVMELVLCAAAPEASSGRLLATEPLATNELPPPAPPLVDGAATEALADGDGDAAAPRPACG